MFICSLPDSDFVLTQRFPVSYCCEILALWIQNTVLLSLHIKLADGCYTNKANLHVMWLRYGPCCTIEKGCLLRQILCYHQPFFARAASLSRLDKFWPKRKNLQTHRRQNLSRVKAGQKTIR